MFDRYILVGHNPVLCDDLQVWIKDFDGKSRTVAKTTVNDILVSTVFLGLSHGKTATGLPILFETMIFGGEHDMYQTRCATWDEAIKMHEAALALVQANSKFGSNFPRTLGG